MRRLIFVSLCVSVIGISQGANQTVRIDYDPSIPQVTFAAEKIQVALDAKGYSFVSQKGQHQILIEIKADRSNPESFSIHTGHEGLIQVVSSDAAGAMYGGLELAEMIRIGGLQGIIETRQSPYLAMRGVKFNCPLDVRTPSYTDVCDSAQQNIAEMWNFEFWKECIDLLAEYRYNYISLWNLHPFPSMVKVPEYPDVALDDVKRSTVKWNENYSINGIGFTAPEILNHTEILKRMTINEKIDFWRKVMRYGKERNVDFYVVTWNIFDYGTEGKYGITDKIDNPITIDYFRKSIKQMFLTYPDLAGVGLTTGENMYGATFEAKEDWAFKTYGQGVLDAAKELPGRKITLIHRQHETGAVDIAERFKPIIDHPDINFIFSFKYAKAHVYSSTTQHYHQSFVKEIQNHRDLKTIWTLRNDDIYYFRWAGPDFVREFVKNIPYEVSRGYYYGSDQWIWGREFLSKNPKTPRQLEIDKHWFQWLLWGRLGYNPKIPNDRFAGIIQARFPNTDGKKLLDAWQSASMIYPLTTGYHWGALDFQWYIEGCKSRAGVNGPGRSESGFNDVNRFITLPPHPSTGYISIPDYVKATLDDNKMNGPGPLDVSNQIHDFADQALHLLSDLDTDGDQELAETLQDIKTIAYLGKYYAHKIDGATNLQMYRASGNKRYQREAVNELKKAAKYWRLYADSATLQYKNPLWTNRVGYVNWDKLYQEVLNDIEIAKVE